jgi:hypothetical protein
MFKSSLSIAALALLSATAHAALTNATNVEMTKEGRVLFVNAKQPIIVLQGVVETLKADGWQEEEKQSAAAPVGPWCALEISETGGTVHSKCYTPQITGIEVRSIHGTFNYTTKAVDLSSIPAMLDKTYTDAVKASTALGIK